MLCYALIVVGLSTGVFLMSVGSIALAANWILEGKFRDKWILAKKRKFCGLWLSGLYLVHLLWLINTSDFDYAFHDLVLKLPLLSFPIVMGSIPALKEKDFKLILICFILGLLISTLISFGVYHQLFPTRNDISDVRNISIFISHIRLSLLICLAIGFLFYYYNSLQMPGLIVALLLAVWFIYFLVLIKGGTGLAVLCCVIPLYLYSSLRKKSNFRISGYVLVSGLLALLLFMGFYVANEAKTYFAVHDTDNPDTIDLFSKGGEKYIHKFEDRITENGYYVMRYIALEELRVGWNKRSAFPFDSLDQRGNGLAGTLMRYLTSMGERKDTEGLNKLSSIDVARIEAGIPSSREMNGLEERLYELFFEIKSYRLGQDFNGHSILQRWEFAKTGWLIFADQPFFGVGTGDVPKSFRDKYNEVNSPLKKENRLRAHNQLLTFLIAFGVVGFIISVFCMFVPYFLMPSRVFLLALFLVVGVVSFFSDDTFETQAGVTFFSFFQSFLLFQNKNVCS